MRKAVNHSVRAAVAWAKLSANQDELDTLFGLASLFLGRTTPRALMQIFPVDKVYSGDKYDCKDYFFTMETLRARPGYAVEGGSHGAALGLRK